jgi:hypothetical protein
MALAFPHCAHHAAWGGVQARLVATKACPNETESCIIGRPKPAIWRIPELPDVKLFVFGSGGVACSQARALTARPARRFAIRD